MYIVYYSIQSIYFRSKRFNKILHIIIVTFIENDQNWHVFDIIIIKNVQTFLIELIYLQSWVFRRNSYLCMKILKLFLGCRDSDVSTNDDLWLRETLLSMILPKALNRGSCNQRNRCKIRFVMECWDFYWKRIDLTLFIK